MKALNHKNIKAGKRIGTERYSRDFMFSCSREEGFTPTPIFVNTICATSDVRRAMLYGHKRISVSEIGVSPHSGRGFTLIETLIAISVLLLAITGPLTIATRGLTSAAFARDQVAAYYLAQEAVELIRNKRDNNHFANENWKDGTDSCFVEDGCYVDSATVDPIFTPCAESGCPLLQKSVTSGFYSYSTGVGTAPSPLPAQLKCKMFPRMSFRYR